MTKKEQKAFVRGLIDGVKKAVLKECDLMPEDWDGHELREYVSDAFQSERSHLLLKGGGRRTVYRRAKYEIDIRRNHR
jgi:hypothetical protein